MFKIALAAFLAFFASSWLVAAININQWLPPDFTVVPESPRVLVGLLAVYVILITTCFLIYMVERMVFIITSKLPKMAVRWAYNILFLVVSYAVTKFVWTVVSDKLIFSNFYQPYAAQFYSSSGIDPLQLNAIFLFSFFILLAVSFFSMRRHTI